MRTVPSSPPPQRGQFVANLRSGQLEEVRYINNQLCVHRSAGWVRANENDFFRPSPQPSCGRDPSGFARNRTTGQFDQLEATPDGNWRMTSTGSPRHWSQYDTPVVTPRLRSDTPTRHRPRTPPEFRGYGSSSSPRHSGEIFRLSPSPLYLGSPVTSREASPVLQAPPTPPTPARRAWKIVDNRFGITAGELRRILAEDKDAGSLGRDFLLFKKTKNKVYVHLALFPKELVAERI